MNHRPARSRFVCLGVLGLCIAAATTSAGADESRSRLSPLALQKHCDECHAVDATRIGPPFIAVAIRHRAEGDAAVEPLAQKIIHGGAGNWGDIPMIPNERVTVEEARALARWILSLKSG
ncbi:MAG TPA: c-type cytochrome [Steroidobacteraceae bacterium]|nr:c-type cytochrome [Steroidobacteraceae bacterium]